MKFGVPMVFRDPENHIDDLYFCLISITGINRNSQNMWHYTKIISARRPVPHSEDVPIPAFYLELCEDEYCLPDYSSDTNEGDSDFEGMSSVLTFLMKVIK